MVTTAQTQEELPVTEELIVSCTAQTLESELTEEYLTPEEMTDVGMAAIDSFLEEEVQVSRDVNLTGPSGTTAQQMVKHLLFVYHPPKVSSMKYCRLGVFRKEYFRLVTK